MSPSSEPLPTPPGRNLLWRTLHVPVGLFCKTWLRVRCSGKENLDPERGGLMLLNHQSFLDPILAAVLLRRPVSYVARDSLFRVPVIGWILRKTHVIPVSRTAFRGQSVRSAVEHLQQGFLVGIFPEGTRSCGTELARFRPGFLAILRRTDLPVYPVAIAGADQAMPKGAWIIRPAKIHVTYGSPLTDKQRTEILSAEDDRTASELARSAVAEAMQVSAAAVNPIPASPPRS